MSLDFWYRIGVPCLSSIDENEGLELPTIWTFLETEGGVARASFAMLHGRERKKN
jgi:hypothetical protein